MNDITSIGIGPPPPPWCEPGTQPNWDSLTTDGTTILEWIRDVGEQVCITANDTIVDGEWVRSPALIWRFCELSQDGLDTAAARRLAAELLNAADLLDG